MDKVTPVSALNSQTSEIFGQQHTNEKFYEALWIKYICWINHNYSRGHIKSNAMLYFFLKTLITLEPKVLQWPDASQNDHKSKGYPLYKYKTTAAVIAMQNSVSDTYFR